MAKRTGNQDQDKKLNREPEELDLGDGGFPGDGGLGFDDGEADLLLSVLDGPSPAPAATASDELEMVDLDELSSEELEPASSHDAASTLELEVLSERLPVESLDLSAIMEEPPFPVGDGVAMAASEHPSLEADSHEEVTEDITALLGELGADPQANAPVEPAFAPDLVPDFDDDAALAALEALDAPMASGAVVAPLVAMSSASDGIGESAPLATSHDDRVPPPPRPASIPAAPPPAVSAVPVPPAMVSEEEEEHRSFDALPPPRSSSVFPGDAGLSAAEELDELLRQIGHCDDRGELLHLRRKAISLAVMSGQPRVALDQAAATLAEEPTDQVARRTAERYLESPSLAPQAAGFLAEAYEATGDHREAAALLEMELRWVRGARRVQVQRRLALLRQEALGDLRGAWALLAEVAVSAPSDREVRTRYLELSRRLRRLTDASTVLRRVLRRTADVDEQRGIALDLALLQLELGEREEAIEPLRFVFSGCVEDGHTLRAAQLLAELQLDANGAPELPSVLEYLTVCDEEPGARFDAARRLLRLRGVEVEASLHDAALRLLASGPGGEEAAARLAVRAEELGDLPALARSLELLGTAAEPTEAPSLLGRAAELHAQWLSDPSRAASSLRQLQDRALLDGKGHLSLERHLLRAGDARAAASVLEVAEQQGAPEAAVELALVQHQFLGEGSAAAASLQRAKASSARRVHYACLWSAQHPELAELANTAAATGELPGNDDFDNWKSFIAGPLSPALRNRLAEEAAAAGRWALVGLIWAPMLTGLFAPLEALAAVKAALVAEKETAAAADLLCRWAEQLLLTGDTSAALARLQEALGLDASAGDGVRRVLGLLIGMGEWNAGELPWAALLGRKAERRLAAGALLHWGDRISSADAELIVRLCDGALSRWKGDGELAGRLRLLMAKAKQRAARKSSEVLLSYQAAAPESGGWAMRREWLAAFSSYMEALPPGDERTGGERWLWQWLAAPSRGAQSARVRWARWEESQGEAKRALAQWTEALQAEPERTELLREVVRLQRSVGQAKEAEKGLRTLREQVEPAERFDVDVELVALYLGELDAPVLAMQSLSRLLAEAGPREEVLAHLRVAVKRDATRAAAARLLQQATGLVQDADARRSLIESLLEGTSDVGELAEQRLSWFLDLLSLQGEEPEQAMELALAALREFPSSFELLRALESLAVELGRPEPVAQAYRELIQSKSLTADEQEELGQRMVEFHEEWFADDPERILSLLQLVLESSDSAGWAFDRLKLQFSENARWNDLFALYDRQLARADGAERVALLREAALAAKDFASDAGRAIDYLERLHQADAADGLVEASLERLYVREQRRRPLIDLLTARVPQTRGPSLQQLRARIAGLWLDLQEPAPAFRLVEDLLAAGGAQLAEPLLLQLLELPASRNHAVDTKTEPPLTIRDRSAEHLQTYYRAGGKVAEVARFMEVGLEAARGEEDLVARLEALVELRLSELDDAIHAFENMAQLVQLRPIQESYRKTFEGLAERTGNQERRAQLLREVATGLPTEDRAVLHWEAATIYECVLGQADVAIELYDTVLQWSSDDVLLLSAARSLDPLLQTARRASERCAVLERRAALETDAALRRRALGDAARVASEELADLPRSIADWRLRLADDPNDLEALDGLADVLRRAQRPAELIEALGRRASLHPDPAQVRSDLVEVARCHAEQLSDGAAAVKAWGHMRERCGHDLESFLALEQLLKSQARWVELAALLASQASEEAGEVSRRRYQELGELHRTRTGQLLESLDAFVAASDWTMARTVALGDGRDRATGRAVLRRLFDHALQAWQVQRDGSAPEQALHWSIEELALRYREEGAFSEAAKLLQEAAALPLPKPTSRGYLADAAGLFADRLGQPEMATELFQKLLDEDLADAVAERVVVRFARLLREEGSHAKLASLWERQAQQRLSVGDSAAAAALWERAAQTYRKQLNDSDKALKAFKQAAMAGLTHAWESVAELAASAGKQTLREEALSELVSHADAGTVALHAMELAELYVERADTTQATEVLERASERAIDATELRQRLAVLYEQRGDWDRLVALQESEAQRAASPRRRVQCLRIVAETHLERRKDGASAVAALVEALQVQPDDAELRLLLASALARSERYGEAEEVLRGQLAAYGPRRPKSRASVHLALAEVLLPLGRDAAAIEELRAATQIDPTQASALELLARLCAAQGDLDAATRTYRALLMALGAAAPGTGPSRARALLALAAIAVRQGDPIRAEEYRESAFEAASTSDVEARALEQVLRSDGPAELLPRVLELRLQQARTASELAKLLAELAASNGEALLQLTGGKDGLAVRVEEIAAGLEESGSDDEGAWAALGKLYAFLGDPEGEAKVLERRVSHWVSPTSRPPDASPFYRLAEVKLRRDDTIPQGIELLQRALTIQADFGRAQGLLRGTLSSDRGGAAVVELLESIARESGDDRELLQVLDDRLAREPGAVEILREASALAESLGDGDRQEALLRRALTWDISDEDALWIREELARLCTAQGRRMEGLQWRESATLFLDAEVARNTLLDVADEAASGDEESQRWAIRLYEQVRSAEPERERAWEALLTLHGAFGQQEELLAVVEETLEQRLDDETKLRLRLLQVEALLQLGGRDDQARKLLATIVAEYPSEARATVLLADLLERDNRWDELASLVGKRLALAREQSDEDAIARLSVRQGKAFGAQGLWSEAVEVYQGALRWAPSDLQVLRALAEALEQQGDSLALATVLEQLLGLAPAGEAEGLCNRLVALRRATEDEAGVRVALELGWKAAPASAHIRDELVAWLGEREFWAEAARVLQGSLDADPTQQSALVLRLVDALHRAGESEAALERLDGAVAAGLTETESLRALRVQVRRAAGHYGEALSELEELVASTGRYQADLLDFLQEAVQLEANPAERTRQRMRLREVARAAREPELVLEQLLALAAEPPRDAAVLAELAKEAESLAQWEAADELLAALGELADTAQLRTVALQRYRVGQQLGDVARAQLLLERASEAAPSDRELTEALESLYEALGSWPELAESLRRRSSFAAGEEQAKLLRRAGDCMLRVDGGVVQALPMLEQAQRLAPTIGGAVLLARCQEGQGDRDAAMASLLTMVEDLRGRRLPEYAGVYAELSRMYREAGANVEALDALGRAVDMDPRDATMGVQWGELALELADEQTAFRAFRAITMMRSFQEDTGEGATVEQKSDAHFYLGLLAYRQGDARKAKILVAKALAENPENQKALELLPALG